MAPTANTSLRASTTPCAADICSGAMYPGVPRIEPTSVRFIELSGASDDRLADGVPSADR